MKLAKWAKDQGIKYQTAWNLFKAGKIEGAYKLQSGTIIIPDHNEKPIDPKIFIYCRVSSSKDNENLIKQKELVYNYCVAKGYQIEGIIKDFGLSSNSKRKGLIKLINSSPTLIVIEYRDILINSGFELIENLLNNQNCKIEVINKTTKRN